jgi:hypothetical protein
VAKPFFHLKFLKKGIEINDILYSKRLYFCVIFVDRGNFCSFAEPHRFDAAPAPGENFDAAPAPDAPAPTVLFAKPTFFKQATVNIRARAGFSSDLNWSKN